MAEPSAAMAVIPGLPPEASAQLLAVLSAEPAVQEVWLYGSRAMGRFRSGSDIDLTLVAPGLRHDDRLRLMGALDDLLLPWSIDLAVARAARTLAPARGAGGAAAGGAWLSGAVMTLDARYQLDWVNA